MPRVGRRRKKKRTEQEAALSEKEQRDTPRCFVLKRGAIGQRVKDLVQDFRMVMMPNCAKSLKESKWNRVEDFTAASGHFGVSHLVIFTTTKQGTYMKLSKLPQGPTLTFRVKNFTLTRSIRAAQKRPRSGTRDYTSAPLQVLNGFGSGGGGESTGVSSVGREGERALTTEMLRGLFPSIDVPSFNQAECRRVALFNHDSEKDTIQFRHYSVGRRQTGMHKGIAALLNPGRLPKLSSKTDVADFVLGCGDSGSDAEDMEASSQSGGKIGVRLTEVGPRLDLQLVKGEEGVLNGAVLFHRYLTRTPSEQEVLAQRAKQRRKLKERNDKLDQEARRHNGTLREKRKAKEKVHADIGKRERGEDPEDDFEGEEGGPDKKRRFHPFAYGSKAGGASTDGTVEMDSRPSKQKQRRGGQDQERQDKFRQQRMDAAEDGGKGGGKGKKGGKGGKGKGGGKGKSSRKGGGKGGKGKPMGERQGRKGGGKGGK